MSRQEPLAGLHPLQLRELLDQQLMAETLDKLAAVIQPQNLVLQRTQTGSSQELLLAAIGAIGRALGIPIHPPAQSDDSQNPVEAIARASRIRLRQITLRGQWWQTASAPVLAYTVDDCPVALLPTTAGGYEVFDPLNQLRGAIDQQSAAAIAPAAYVFIDRFRRSSSR